MPELPDVQIYIERLHDHIVGRRLEKVRLVSPFLLRSVEPPLREAEGKCVLSLRRLGKRIAIGLEDDLYLVLHLMIAGRLRWRRRDVKLARKVALAAFDFESGTLLLTEASTKKRASLNVVRGPTGLDALDPGGLEVLESDASEFREALLLENRTLKRALTDPRLFSGIGNAYSDEILHRARLSPLKRTRQLDEGEIARLYEATVTTLQEWIQRLRAQVGDGFPEKVTAFRDEMAVHGKYRQPCPVCGEPVQRIVYAANECNYCATCQTEGKLLADRALSRLLREDWPKTLEELEDMKTERARKLRHPDRGDT